MIQLAPSLLSANFTRLEEEVAAVTRAGADYLHLDIMDGHFVPNLTIGADVVRAIGKIARLPMDVHLMVSPVDPFIPLFAEAGAAILTVHAEATHHLDRTLHLVREHAVKVGLAFNPATPLHLLDHVIHLVDMIVIMTVNPGFGGQQFIPEMLPKIAAAADRIQASGRAIALEVDGGIKVSTIRAAAQAGAQVFVAGSAVFSAPGPGPEPDYTAILHQLRATATAG